MATLNKQHSILKKLKTPKRPDKCPLCGNHLSTNICERDDYYSRYLKESIDKSIRDGHYRRLMDGEGQQYPDIQNTNKPFIQKVIGLLTNFWRRHG